MLKDAAKDQDASHMYTRTRRRALAPRAPSQAPEDARGTLATQATLHWRRLEALKSFVQAHIVIIIIIIMINVYDVEY